MLLSELPDLFKSVWKWGDFMQKCKTLWYPLNEKSLHINQTLKTLKTFFPKKSITVFYTGKNNKKCHWLNAYGRKCLLIREGQAVTQGLTRSKKVQGTSLFSSCLFLPLHQIWQLPSHLCLPRRIKTPWPHPALSAALGPEPCKEPSCACIESP